MIKYSYTPSPVKWNNAFPAHWQFIRGKYLYKKQSRPVRNNDEVVTCFRDGMVTLRKNRRTTGFTESLKEIGYQGIRKGDLVIHVMDAFAGAIGVSDSDGKGTPVYSVCTPKMDLNNYYYAYLLRDIARRGYIQSLYKGIRERSSDFRFEVFGNQFYPVPPREEQDQIVRFLDWKVSEINRLINIKRKEIARLEELKKAVISHAVTKGLDNSVEMRNSGVAWLGIIPCHWEVSKVKHHFYIENGSDPSTVGDIPVYGSGAESFKTCGEYKCGPTVLLGRKGATLHIPHYITGKYWNVDTAFNTVAKAGCRIEMLYFYYLATLFDYEYYKTQTTLPSMTQFNYKNMTVPVPPLEEQKDILQHLDYELSKIDSTIEAKKTEIDCLREFKTRLISDVVTGKIDVRGIEIPEYEYTAEEADTDSEAEAEEFDEQEV